MLTKLICRNFKNFEEVEIELGNSVVFIGPNNSGKTTALHALALWEIGLKRWNEHRRRRPQAERRRGITVNRRDLISVPVPDAKLLWRNLQVRNVQENVRIDIIVEGVTASKQWTCGLEFDYANQESFYCRPLRLSEVEGKVLEQMPVPEGVANLNVAFLPPMSGLASNETRLDPGAINVRVGEGRTAEVLRNLCHHILWEREDSETWTTICQQIKELFGVQLNNPHYIPERGEIEMNYQDKSGIPLDLSSSGRGLQQTLLLLAYIGAHPGAVLLLDEPDAHLEILRQRQIYQKLTEWAATHNSQIIAASHSEVILNEAAGRDMVIAFLGHPHRIDDRGSQLLKSLKSIGFEQYSQAEQKGWVLYLEGSTDLAILQAFAEKLGHPVQNILKRPFVHYVENQPQKARDHFYGLREAKTDLVGFCLFDRIESELQARPELREYKWKQCEIENYLCQREVLMAWAEAEGKKQSAGPLFAKQWLSTMEKAIAEIEGARATLGESSPWSPDIKASNDFLDRLFNNFFKKLGLENLMRKTNYHTLVQHVPPEQIAPEVSQVLDEILGIANQANPMDDG
jgi:energy-coupling factor transporter ATP-binding protein EcfA2